MGCPKVTVRRIGRGPSYAEAVRDALDKAKRAAAQICLQSGAECSLIDMLQVEEVQVHSANPWELTLAVTFQCRRPKGCCLIPFAFLFGGRGESILGMDLEASTDLGIPDFPKDRG